MAFGAGSYGICPLAKPRREGIALLKGKCMRHVCKRDGPVPQIRNPGSDFSSGGRPNLKSSLKGCDLRRESFAVHHLGPRRFSEMRECVAAKANRVFQALEDSLAWHCFHQFPASICEGQQVASQVSAVHCRNVLGLQRPHRRGLIPIVEVALKALESL